MSIQNIVTTSHHEVFHARLKLLIGRATLQLMQGDKTDPPYVDNINAAYDCLTGKVPIDAIALLVLSEPTIKGLVENDASGVAESVPDSAILTFLLAMLPIAAPVLKIRRGGSY